MKELIALLLLAAALTASIAKADSTGETWSTDGKTFSSEALVKRYIVASGKRLEIEHTRCEIMTNALKFKKCPKQKEKAFENEQFKSITETK